MDETTQEKTDLHDTVIEIIWLAGPSLWTQPRSSWVWVQVDPTWQGPSLSQLRPGWVLKPCFPWDAILVELAKPFEDWYEHLLGDDILSLELKSWDFLAWFTLPVFTGCFGIHLMLSAILPSDICCLYWRTSLLSSLIRFFSLPVFELRRDWLLVFISMAPYVGQEGPM